MLSVVCWRWPPLPGYRATFGPQTVNVLRSMVARCYTDPHRFLCVTNDRTGIDPRVEIVKPWNDFVSVPNPNAARGRPRPSCFRRLRAFHPDIAATFGERFVSLDLDVVLVGDVRPLWNRLEDFVCYGGTHATNPYNGSMWLLRAGTRPQVWERFNPETSPAQAKAAGFFGSDQGWISACLGPDEARWGQADGVYSFRNAVRPLGALPSGARMVVMHGAWKPWDLHVKTRHPWVHLHYR